MNFSQELAQEIGKLRELQERRPELSGLSLAFDRGNVSVEEYETATEADAAIQRELAATMQRIEALAARDHDAFQEYLTAMIATLDRLDMTKGSGVALVALLPAVRETLKARLEGRPSREPLEWALRIADECGRRPA